MNLLDLVRFAPDGRIVYAPSDPTHPPEIEVADAEGKNARAITRLHASLLAAVKLASPEKIHARNSDGDDVESWLYPPLDPQPGRKYPLILYIHGGPQSFDGDYFDTDLENQVFPARGFAVLRVNYRGSTSYGETLYRVTAVPGEGMREILIGGAAEDMAAAFCSNWGSLEAM